MDDEPQNLIDRVMEKIDQSRRGHPDELILETEDSECPVGWNVLADPKKDGDGRRA